MDYFPEVVHILKEDWAKRTNAAKPAKRQGVWVEERRRFHEST
jgi:hypothetical protein